MVKWKGEIDRDSCGGKAARLDSLEELNVPNFFVLTREEVRQIVNGSDTPEEITESEMPGEIREELGEAHGEVGMSSEVREAPGKARNLVGGQRNSQSVSVRVSGDEKGVFEHRLDVGASELEKAVLKVIASYYRAETERDYPAVIVQKMVEPGYTGAAINSYLGKYQLLEAVKGLGTSLEKGITEPAFYLLEDGEAIERRVPGEQVTVTKNRMNGNHVKDGKQVEPPFEAGEVEELFGQLGEKSVKFVYKRGSFYIVDVFENRMPPSNTSLEAVRVSNGMIEGRIGREIVFSDETVPPKEYREGLISSKGGFTSKDAQLARREGKPAIFSFKHEVENGEKVSLSQSAVSASEEEIHNEPNAMSFDPRTGTEVLPVETEDGISLTGSRKARYSIGRDIPRDTQLTGYGDFFSFSGEKAVIDARELGDKAIQEALEYIEADFKILLVSRPDPGIVEAGLESGVDVFGISESQLEQLRNLVMKKERKLLLDHARESK